MIVKGINLGTQGVFYLSPLLIIIPNTTLLVLLSSPYSGWLTGFLDVLGGAYAACALFNIGIFMVGKMKKVTLTLLLISMLLILAKTWVCCFLLAVVLTICLLLFVVPVWLCNCSCFFMIGCFSNYYTPVLVL